MRRRGAKVDRPAIARRRQGGGQRRGDAVVRRHQHAQPAVAEQRDPAPAAPRASSPRISAVGRCGPSSAFGRAGGRVVDVRPAVLQRPRRRARAARRSASAVWRPRRDHRQRQRRVVAGARRPSSRSSAGVGGVGVVVAPPEGARAGRRRAQGSSSAVRSCPVLIGVLRQAIHARPDARSARAVAGAGRATGRAAASQRAVDGGGEALRRQSGFVGDDRPRPRARQRGGAQRSARSRCAAAKGTSDGAGAGAAAYPSRVL